MRAADTSPPARCIQRRSGDISFLYATKKPFAHRWAEQVVAERGKKTGFHSLPERKGVRKR